MKDKRLTHDSVGAQGYQYYAMPTGTFDKLLHMVVHGSLATSLLGGASYSPDALLSALSEMRRINQRMSMQMLLTQNSREIMLQPCLQVQLRGYSEYERHDKP